MSLATFRRRMPKMWRCGGGGEEGIRQLAAGSRAEAGGNSDAHGDDCAAAQGEYARDMTREMGKVMAETRGDVQEAIDEAFYVAGEGRRLFGVTDAIGAARTSSP